MMTEGIFPTLLHPDPRYFRRHEKSRRSRLGYAVSRLFITRTDSGRNQFNYSEVVGAATSLAISNAYYPDGRSLGHNAGRYVLQLGFDAASNVLKEFWPDLKRKLPRQLGQSRRRHGVPVRQHESTCGIPETLLACPGRQWGAVTLRVRNRSAHDPACI